MEEWRQITDYPNYQVSNLGRVKNQTTQKVHTPAIRNGYHAVSLPNEIGNKMMQVHRLVSMAFLPNPENKLTVNHKDHDKLNNHLDNLEWATMSEQNAHKRKGTNYSHGKTIWRLDKETRKRLEKYDSVPKAMQWVIDNGYSQTCIFSPGNISAAALNKHEYAFGFKWEYETNQELQNEEWREIPPEFVNGNSGYFVSNKGRFRNGVIIKEGSSHASGYLYVSFKDKKYALHRLIAQTFIPNPENKSYVNHKDGNKENACLDNLEWSTPTENQLHAVEIGSKTCRAVTQYDTQMNKLQEFPSAKAAAKALHITNTRVILSCIKKIKYHVDGFVFRYADEIAEPPSVRKAVVQYDLYMNKIREFETLQEASKELNINPNSIYLCCTNKQPMTGHYVFKYLDDAILYTPTDTPLKKYNEIKKVVQYDLQMNKIREFDSVREASRILNISGNGIGDCCQNKAKSAGKYIFKYLDDPTIYTPLETPIKLHNERKSIVQYDLQMNPIQTFNSLRKVVKELNIKNYKAISDCCQGKRHNVGDYIFQYAT